MENTHNTLYVFASLYNDTIIIVSASTEDQARQELIPTDTWQLVGADPGFNGVCRLTMGMAAVRRIEKEIARRGLIELYQNALIKILGLDMQVFNSAIELDPHFSPSIPNNTFKWEGHAFLWLFSHPTSSQCAHAFLQSVEQKG